MHAKRLLATLLASTSTSILVSASETILARNFLNALGPVARDNMPAETMLPVVEAQSAPSRGRRQGRREEADSNEDTLPVTGGKDRAGCADASELLRDVPPVPSSVTQWFLEHVESESDFSAFCGIPTTAPEAVQSQMSAWDESYRSWSSENADAVSTAVAQCAPLSSALAQLCCSSMTATETAAQPTSTGGDMGEEAQEVRHQTEPLIETKIKVTKKLRRMNNNNDNRRRRSAAARAGLDRRSTIDHLDNDSAALPINGALIETPSANRTTTTSELVGQPNGSLSSSVSLTSQTFAESESVLAHGSGNSNGDSDEEDAASAATRPRNAPVTLSMAVVMGVILFVTM